jgi:hypothetical protein
MDRYVTTAKEARQNDTQILYTDRILLNRNNSFMMSLIAKKTASDSVTEKDELDSAIKVVAAKNVKLQSKIKRNSVDVGNIGFNAIREEVNKANVSDVLITVIQSEFQADSTLAASNNNNESEMILSADSDLAALLGAKCISIKSFTFWDCFKKTLKDLDIDESHTFSRIPKTTIDINSKPTDDKRRTFYKETFRCKMFFTRLGIRQSVKEQTYLTYCSSHPLQTELFDIGWRDRDGEKTAIVVCWWYHVIHQHKHLPIQERIDC